MIHLLRHGETGQRPPLSLFFHSLRPNEYVTRSAVMTNFLDGLASHKKFTAADEAISAAVPSTLWPAIPEHRLFDLIVTAALRAPGGLNDVPTNPILTVDELDFLAAKQLRAGETLQLLTIRSSLTRRAESPYQRAWLFAHDLAALYEHMGHEQLAAYLDVVLDQIERFRARFFARIGI